MGHAASAGSIALDAYSKTCWEDLVAAVNSIVEAGLSEPDHDDENPLDSAPATSSDGGN
jgi:hypothetical protein